MLLVGDYHFLLEFLYSKIMEHIMHKNPINVILKSCMNSLDNMLPSPLYFLIFFNIYDFWTYFIYILHFLLTDFL